MTRLESITDAYLLATTKTTLPTGNKLSQLNALATKYYREWQREPGIEWESLSRDVSAGTAAAGTDTYELDEDIHFISKDSNNFVTIGTTKYKVVTSAQLNRYQYSNAIAHIVEDGTHSIKFSRAFATDDDLIGTEITVPCVIKLDDLDSDSSEVLIDDPQWLAVRVAAQYCYSYKSLRDMYDVLLEQANELMTGMIQANDSGTESSSTGIDYFAAMGNVGNDC